jgi:hypothetical protein
VQEVLVTVGERHQLVAGHRDPNVCLGVALGGLGDLVQPVRTESADEGVVEVTEPAEDPPPRNVARAQVRIHRLEQGRQLVEGDATRLDIRHAA